ISLLEDMDLESAHMVVASKVPMLKIENGNFAPKTTVVEGVEKVIPPTTVKEEAQKRLEYENFTAPSSETIDQTFDWLQKLVSQLEILGETLSQEDVNQKLLRSLSPEWNTHAVVWRNKPDLETMIMDDRYNNLIVMNRNTNGAVNTAYGATTVSTQATAVNSTTIDNLSDAVIYGLEVADGYANNKGKEILEEDWKKSYYEWY
ncbi:hypothetical protein Tco_1579408, partial [Tanacetum coccineum]